MKINKLNESIKFDIDTELSGDNDIDVQEVLIREADLRHFIDIKYGLEDVITLAKQLDNSIKNADMEKSYEVLIDYFDEFDPDYDEPETEDIGKFCEYMTDCIYNSEYFDEAERKAQEELEDVEMSNEGQKDIERDYFNNPEYH